VDEEKVMTLDKILEAVGRVRGILIRDDSPGTNYVVVTKNSTYDITVLDGAERRVRVQGGEYFPEPVLCILSGSTYGGSVLKVGWIGLGMCMEFFHEGRPIITTAVRSIGIKTDGIVCHVPNNSVH
jgi:hypothetical protein